MLSSVLVCTMVVMSGAIAVNKPAVPVAHSPFRIPAVKRVIENPAPCTFPPYFTFDQANILTSAYEGSLLVEYVNVAGAYDGIAKKYSVEAILDYFNGTLYSLHVLEDYNMGQQFLIYRSGHEVDCVVFDIEGQRFPKEYSIPDSAEYYGEATIGDRDLVVDSWHSKSEDGSVETEKIVTRGECVPVAFISRTFHPDTGVQIEVVENQLFNFRLGICDPDDYFNIPEVCQQESALKEPTGEMQKQLRRMRRFRLVG